MGQGQRVFGVAWRTCGCGALNTVRGLGALLGYGGGMAIGAVWGLLWLSGRPGRLAGVALGAAAMIPTNLPMVAMGLTDPRTWGLAGSPPGSSS